MKTNSEHEQPKVSVNVTVDPFDGCYGSVLFRAIHAHIDHASEAQQFAATIRNYLKYTEDEVPEQAEKLLSTAKYIIERLTGFEQDDLCIE